MTDFIQLELFDASQYSSLKTSLSRKDCLRRSIEENMSEFLDEDTYWDWEIYDLEITTTRKIAREKLLLLQGSLREIDLNKFFEEAAKNLENSEKNWWEDIVCFDRFDSLNLIDIESKYLEIIEKVKPYLQELKFDKPSYRLLQNCYYSWNSYLAVISK